jgi:hypothetical protein
MRASHNRITNGGHNTKSEKFLSYLERFVGYILKHLQSLLLPFKVRRVLNMSLEFSCMRMLHRQKIVSSFPEIANAKHGIDVTAHSNQAQSFFTCVRSTSADHISCPYVFALVACLMSSMLAGGRDVFETPEQKYSAADVCRHLATMCRMHNDYGSVRQDELEGNLNSVNFPEFKPSESGGRIKDSVEVVEHRKTSLFKIVEHKRQCLLDAFGT